MRHWIAACLSCSLLAGTTGAEQAADAKGDSVEAADRIQKIHAHFSAGCFNKCWGLIDKPNRSADDVEDMLLLAHASLWHWKQRADCKPLNLSIGYWHVSRVYALAGEYEMARLFGTKCLDVGQDNRLPPFYLGYAYEALARAELFDKKGDQAKELLAKAREELKGVADKEEQQLLAADLDSLEKSVTNKAGDGGR
jgi:hypothetical protein